MHEIGLAEAILDVALEQAAGTQIREVRIRIGDLHAVDDESFTFAFGLVASGTEAAGATLSIDRVAVRTACRTCGAERAGPAVLEVCARCGATDAVAVAGDELAVVAIGLADGEWRYAPGADAAVADVPAAP